MNRAARRRMAAALSRGEPVHLRLGRADHLERWQQQQLFPLCASVVDASGHNLSAGGTGRRAHSPSGPAVTAVIPCHRKVPAGLAALLRQDWDVDVLIISNGSGPQRVPGARVVRSPWRGHGRTRQDALAHVNTPLVLFLSDDALPLGAGFVGTLADALVDRPWDAVVARQVPWPDAPTAVRRRIAAWTPWAPSVQSMPQADHVATLHRTALLREAPLPPVDIAEDLVWSMGRRVGLVPDAVVLHSHPLAPIAQFRRARAEHQVRREAGLYTPVVSISALFSGVPAVARDVVHHGPLVGAAAAGELLGQWVGARRGR